MLREQAWRHIGAAAQRQLWRRRCGAAAVALTRRQAGPAGATPRLSHPNARYGFDAQS
jgi:hypothetical protein